MDFESTDLNREASPVEEGAAPYGTEQIVGEPVLEGKPVIEEMEPCKHSETEYVAPEPVTEPQLQATARIPVDNSNPYGHRPPVQHGQPYGGVPYGAYGYMPNSHYYQQGNVPPANYGTAYPRGQAPYNGGNYVPFMREAFYTPPTPYVPQKPVVQKNHKPVCALILGILAMGILNYVPIVALVLSLIALCTAYIGLKQGKLTKGKRICGFIGLALGIIGLILSVTMLTMVLSLLLRAAKETSNSANSIFR